MGADNGLCDAGKGEGKKEAVLNRLGSPGVLSDHPISSARFRSLLGGPCCFGVLWSDSCFRRTCSCILVGSPYSNFFSGCTPAGRRLVPFICTSPVGANPQVAASSLHSYFSCGCTPAGRRLVPSHSNFSSGCKPAGHRLAGHHHRHQGSQHL